MTFSTCYGSKSIVAGLVLSDVNGAFNTLRGSGI